MDSPSLRCRWQWPCPNCPCSNPGRQRPYRNQVAFAFLSFWETLYPSKSGINWAVAASDLFEQQASNGVYDPERVRGRGAWLDEGRVIFHLGDRGEHLTSSSKRPPLSPGPLDRRWPPGAPLPAEPLRPLEPVAGGDPRGADPRRAGAAAETAQGADEKAGDQTLDPEEAAGLAGVFAAVDTAAAAASLNGATGAG